VLTPDWDTLRLFLHVLGATIWVGGQLTLAALVPALRAYDLEVPKVAAQAFNRVAWPAFGLLVLTGIWNVVAESDKSDDSAYQTTLVIKIVVVIASGATAWLHTRSRTPRERAVYGALTGVTALLALLLGVLLAG
jgi:putative copper export protein